MVTAQNKPTSLAPYAPVLLALSAGGFLVTYKAILYWVSPLILLSTVMGGTALLIGGSILCFHGVSRLKVRRRFYGLLLLLGLCATILNGSMIWAVELSEASQVSLLLRSDILFSALIGFFFFGERISRPGVSGLLLMSAGAFLVLRMLPWQLEVVSKGDMLAVLAGFLLSTNAIIIKYGLAEVPDEVIAFYNAGLVTILSLVIVILSGSLQSYIPLQSPMVVGLSGLAILLSSSMFLLYYRSLALHPVWLVRAFLLLAPFVTMVLSGWVLDEKVVRSQWVGGVLLAAGGTVLLRDAKTNSAMGKRG